MGRSPDLHTRRSMLRRMTASASRHAPDGWFFPISVAGQVAVAWSLALIVRLRPGVAAGDANFAAKAAGCGIALGLWTLGSVVLYPGVLDPWVDEAGPFTRLPGTWVAAAAGWVTAAALLAIAARSRSVR